MEPQGEHAVEVARIDLKKMIENVCRRVNLFQMMKLIGRRVEMVGQEERKREEKDE